MEEFTREYDRFFDAGWSLVVLLIAICVAKALQVVLVKFFSSKRVFHGELTACIINHVRRPLLWVLIFTAIAVVLPMVPLPKEWLAGSQLYIRPLIVAMVGWFFIGVVHGVGEWLEEYYPAIKIRDAMGTRRFNTQLRILIRVVVTVVMVLTIIGMAMVIPALRQLGMSLFASAGVAGIVLGIAAKETLSNIIAGAQLALTQQILLGDEVVVSGRSGVIEEITSSYVVVRMWDLRRLVVPLRFFMENPFENWTYHEPEVFGSVTLFLDYTADIPHLRAEAEEIVQQSSLWDGKRCDVRMVDNNAETLQIRVALSGKNSSDVWSLQCEVREKLIHYLQQSQPDALPKKRVELNRESPHSGIDNPSGCGVGI